METIGVIGGTSLSSIETLDDVEQQVVDTEYGKPSAPLLSGKKSGKRIVFINRHGSNPRIAPHKINYRANIAAFKKVGVEKIIAISAVGGISEDATPASIVIPHQLIDYSYGREHTFFDQQCEAQNHIDFTEPYSKILRASLLTVAEKLPDVIVKQGIYGVVQGPRLETAAEINRMERDGCTLVGMTGMPEAALAREAEIDYASVAMVVNWAAGRSIETTTLDVVYKNIETGEKTLNSLLDAFFGSNN